MRNSLLALLFGVCFLSSWSYVQRSTFYVQPTPNIIIINMDDMGYGDPVCYGGGPYKTPNIDALAARGKRFTNFYAAQAVCTASRSALMTGCYPTRLGISGAWDHMSKYALNPDEETIAELLQKKGYATGMVGKWHLGHKEPYLPLQNGFQEFFGLPYSNDMWPVDYDGTDVTGTSNRKAYYPPLPLISGNKTIGIVRTLDDQGHLTKRYTEKAVDFIGRKKSGPFFLYFAHSMVHVPIAASEKFRGKSGAGLFGDVMEEVDWSVGEIMKTLEKYKLTENTLVIFTSDNGPWLIYGNHAGNSGGLREGKGTAWDGGLKVPFIISWPGKIKSNTVESSLMTNMDILPTIADICEAGLPSQKIDGLSFRGLMEGKPGKGPRSEFVYYYERNNLKAIRKDGWKLNFPCRSQTYGPPATIGKDGYPGQYGSDTVYLALYNLYTDPGEDRDLKAHFPDVVRQLDSIAQKYRVALGDGLTGQSGSEVREAAKIK
ncbi:sulfatase [Pollutibacter soli]|uniref:sulfatase family protein n=1 Tax=Pollutibacter soli TaxID=3034157 RepID=UPI003013CECB